MGIENLAVVGDELAIRWQDGEESYLKLAHLREKCPCASCQGEPDALGRVIRPVPSMAPRSNELQGWDFVGGYALQLSWADGHRTGIYSFAYLKDLAKEAS